ncbi:hypothetical protein BC829DRAFT_418124 [Chytridium lagenaria]|nr:hypothetical protein BC829DRAFT_418124 [Chytridium lagenaria]
MSDELVNRTLNTYVTTLNSVLHSDGDAELSEVDVTSLRADIEMIKNGAREPYHRQPYRQGYPPRNNDFGNRSRQSSSNSFDYNRSRQGSGNSDQRGTYTSYPAGNTSNDGGNSTPATMILMVPPVIARLPALLQLDRLLPLLLVDFLLTITSFLLSILLVAGLSPRLKTKMKFCLACFHQPNSTSRDP